MGSESKAPPGCIIDDQGVVRKVLGTLPLTADGCVACGTSMLYIGAEHWGTVPGVSNGTVHIDLVGPRIDGLPVCARISAMYSTREAALASKGAQHGH